ncbi:MAG: hypothetical protein NC453_07530 [Muribaculum sp.]|nr:hypothetical protein [Muribaculum sp.]
MSFWNFIGGFALFNTICDWFSSRPKKSVLDYQSKRETTDQSHHELRPRINHNNYNLDDLQERIDELENRLYDVDIMSDRYDEIQDKIDELQERIDYLEEMEDLQDELDDLSDELDDLEIDYRMDDEEDGW